MYEFNYSIRPVAASSGVYLQFNNWLQCNWSCNLHRMWARTCGQIMNGPTGQALCACRIARIFPSEKSCVSTSTSSYRHGIVDWKFAHELSDHRDYNSECGCSWIINDESSTGMESAINYNFLQIVSILVGCHHRERHHDYRSLPYLKKLTTIKMSFCCWFFFSIFFFHFLIFIAEPYLWIFSLKSNGDDKSTGFLLHNWQTVVVCLNIVARNENEKKNISKPNNAMQLMHVITGVVFTLVHSATDQFNADISAATIQWDSQWYSAINAEGQSKTLFLAFDRKATEWELTHDRVRLHGRRDP